MKHKKQKMKNAEVKYNFKKNLFKKNFHRLEVYKALSPSPTLLQDFIFKIRNYLIDDFCFLQFSIN